ncbi:C45 family autoproteolytic acyltransferase/hydolase [Halarsenatibacter silvermanii]|uniref:C45 family autoproteolytic acyltransferase/hydolase n=1 Tax=Halarsenatibacter silvermanii TaxID=321763 RepID=UPI00135660DF|nr:C45 family peptidase [Halarsenatibacter silvermanii]
MDEDLQEQAEEITVEEDNRSQIGPVDLIRVEGSPYEMGYQQGALLSEEIAELIDLMYEEAFALQEESLPRRLVAEFYMRRAALSFFGQTPDRFRREMQGIADGAEADLYDILLLNVYDELFNLAGCTNIAVWGENTRENELLMGRNLDYYYPQIMYDRQVVTHYIPEEGSQFAAVDFPGYIGVLTGLNQQGLALGSLTAPAPENSLEGVPTGIVYRMIMETAGSLEEAEELLRDNPRTIGNNLLVAAAKSRQAYIFEISPAEVYTRKPAGEENFIAAANHFNELENETLRESSLFRQERAEELLAEFTAGESEAEAAGRDRQDVIDILNDREQIEIEDYGFYSIGNNRNIQSAVIQPDQLEMWLSINQDLPAADGDFYGLKLKPEEEKISPIGEE